MGVDEHGYSDGERAKRKRRKEEEERRRRRDEEDTATLGIVPFVSTIGSILDSGSDFGGGGGDFGGGGASGDW